MKVKIYKPAKNTMQSGMAKTQKWVMEYELESPRVPEETMGWISSEDTLNQVKIKFDSKEDAIAFAEKEGFEYSVSEAHERIINPRSYVDNFKYVPAEKD